MGREPPHRHHHGTDTTLELAELLSHSARRLHRGSTAQLAPLGITNAQARVLRIVASAGQPLRMAEIAARLDVVPRSVTTMVDGVETAGLIVRSADPADRRSVLVSLTAQGQALLERLESARRSTAEDIFGRLAAEERSDLARLLDALCRRDGCCRCAPHHHDISPHEDEERT
jgi:DNA-binding MarR family transcriptional regulator